LEHEIKPKFCNKEFGQYNTLFHWIIQDM